MNHLLKKKGYERRFKTSLEFRRLRICYEDSYIKKYARGRI